MKSLKKFAIKHIGLYEKFGWTFIGEVKTFKKHSPIGRLYKLEIK